MPKVAIIGCTGYSGQELADLLASHPEAELSCVTARVDEPLRYSDLYPRFAGRIDLSCETLDIERVSQKADLIFLALPHTVSMDVAPGFLSRGKKVIDLSGDYRLPVQMYEHWYGKTHSDSANIEKAVYGLPEMNRDRIKKAALLSNPGCYPTSVILGLLPMASLLGSLEHDIIVDAKSGATGAGRKASLPLSFSEIDEDVKCYKANQHQHMPEMQTLLSSAAGAEVRINFTPHILPIRRGIMSTMYMKADGFPQARILQEKYREYFSEEPFVRVRSLGDFPRIADVVNTNFCDIGITVSGGLIIIVSVIDNLLKGAAGQAVQNMNIMYSLEETAGLI